ncbi:tRNA (5-methylaminomethyl-2-thiouridylate)-methyltransferase [Lachnospiraceae bacterium]|nr:tRNA (5-methylaminomethyl-2-thiouridylate)-methyltransferase [Lachnospiraceae bacterium]
MSKGTVVVGMSGGVDSSVAAYLLKEEGYNVIGVTMQIWQADDAEETARDNGCCGITAVDDARRVAERIGIPYYVMNFREEFQQNVIDYFTREYLAGRTPNPCIACNRYVKWESLLQKSMALGADYIATGHYAQVVKLPNGRYSLHMSKTQAKDQTYALYNLTQEQLKHTLMPVGAYEKPEVREIAERIGLPVSHKPDSQEICFINDNDYAGFIEKEVERENERTADAGSKLVVPGPGNFVTADGKILGQHKGITHYTIGQRRGLGLPMGHHVFVTEIRPETNEVVIGENTDVFTTSLLCNALNFMSVEDLPIGEKARVMGKIRYKHGGEMCTLTRVDEDTIRADFDTPVRAVTPGQAVVFYDGDVVYGGGTIMGPVK